MSKRSDFVTKMQAIFGENYFCYGGYTDCPDKLPYCLYLEIPTEKRIISDDHHTIRLRRYLVRLVTAYKDWDLEDEIEFVFDDLDFDYYKVTDEPFKSEKVHSVEWEIEFIDDKVRKTHNADDKIRKSQNGTE